MKLTRDDDSYWNSSALLAIHSAVSYSDALRKGLGDTKLSSDDHRKAAESLEQVLSSRGLADQTGLKHLRYLLSKKNVVAYEYHRFERTDYEALFTRAERFAHWARKTGRQLQIEGWNNVEQ